MDKNADRLKETIQRMRPTIASTSPMKLNKETSSNSLISPDNNPSVVIPHESRSFQ
jgi:hypothetical protein